MTTEELTKMVIENGKNISAQQEKLDSAHKRIDENERITEGIHKLASNVNSLTLQIKMLAESMESNIDRLEVSLKGQGERIGKLEREPADRWKTLVGQIIGLAAAAVVGGLFSQFI